MLPCGEGSWLAIAGSAGTWRRARAGDGTIERHRPACHNDNEYRPEPIVKELGGPRTIRLRWPTFDSDRLIRDAQRLHGGYPPLTAAGTVIYLLPVERQIPVSYPLEISVDEDTMTVRGLDAVLIEAAGGTPLDFPIEPAPDAPCP